VVYKYVPLTAIVISSSHLQATCRAKRKMAKLTVSGFLCLLIFVALLIQLSNAAYNVVSFGAKPDGKADATQPFLKAWASACSSTRPSTIYVPKGRFLLKATVFRGPCKSRITVQIDGTLVAPLDYRALGNSGYWILFIQVNDVTVYGGTLDAKGAGFWACRKSGKTCPVGARVRYLNNDKFYLTYCYYYHIIGIL
jgi:polygalacturonase